ELNVSPKGAEGTPKKMELVKPMADFSQKGFEVRFAVDGEIESPEKGWAVSPAFGVTHWATFQLKEPIDIEQGTVLTFKLHCQFATAGLVPGRFRISLATTKEPVGLSLSEELGAVLMTSADQRSETQQAALV